MITKKEALECYEQAIVSGDVSRFPFLLKKLRHIKRQVLPLPAPKTAVKT